MKTLNSYAIVLVLFLISGTDCFAQDKGQSPANSLTDLDRELMRSSKNEHLSFFFDETPCEDDSLPLIPTPKRSNDETTVQYATDTELSSFAAKDGVLLLWHRPDVVALAKHLVAGAGIHRIGEPEFPTGTKDSEDAQTKVKPKSRGPQNLLPTGSSWDDPWQIRLEQVTSNILELEVLATDGTVEKTQRPLSDLPSDIQQLITARTQNRLLHDSTDAMLPLWLNDASWEGVTLTIRKIPSQVVRQADYYKPRPLLSILCVSKLTYLDGQGKRNISSFGIAVLKSKQ